jgi:hypothetical protein
MPIEGVIFDIGGVLEFNPSTGWPERWAGRLGIALDEFEHLVTSAQASGEIGTQSLTDIEDRTAKALEIDQSTIAELMEDMWTEYVGTLNRELVELFHAVAPSIQNRDAQRQLRRCARARTGGARSPRHV